MNIELRAWIKAEGLQQMIYLNGFLRFGDGWQGGDPRFKFYELYPANGGFSKLEAKDVVFMQLVENNEPLNRKVFTGDILKAYRRDDNEKKKPVFSEVTLLNGCFMAFNCTWHELYRLWQSDFEVVGNIYENPKLLKK